MDRLFLDANVLYSAAYRPDSGLLQLWKLKDVILCSSRYALAEANFNLDEGEQRRRLADLAEKLELVETPERALPRGVSLPEKDVPILIAAIAAGATHLLTGDLRHFGDYLGKRLEGVLIMVPGEYLRRRSRNI